MTQPDDLIKLVRKAERSLKAVKARMDGLKDPIPYDDGSVCDGVSNMLQIDKLREVVAELEAAFGPDRPEVA